MKGFSDRAHLEIKALQNSILKIINLKPPEFYLLISNEKDCSSRYNTFLHWNDSIGQLSSSWKCLDYDMEHRTNDNFLLIFYIYVSLKTTQIKKTLLIRHNTECKVGK